MKLRFCSPLCLTILLLPAVTLADIGPALTGLAAGGRDATSVFWSPAAITRLEHSELVIQSGLVYQDAKFKVDSATFDGGSADNDNGLLLVPGLHYVHKLSDNFRLGLSLSVPSGIGNDYGKTWSGRYLSTESTLTFLAAAAPLAYRINDKWSIAGGPFLMYVDSKNKARVNNLVHIARSGQLRILGLFKDQQNCKPDRKGAGQVPSFPTVRPHTWSSRLPCIKAPLARGLMHFLPFGVE